LLRIEQALLKFHEAAMDRSSTYRDMMITAIKALLMAVYIHELLENSLSTIAWIVLDDEILERKLANITIS
jgi:hypothetical protein